MERLKMLRKQHKKSQKEIADIIGTTGQTYGKYELGAVNPSPDTLKKLADYFYVSIDYLLGHESPAETIPPIFFGILRELRNGNGLTQQDAERIVDYIILLKNNKKG
ncbi:MAG: helix-turn-helix domain-containing protein [Firmicutes bacterium]|nr:helix-turn-helix domain-containing protein [Bacillota bacterium]